MRLNKKTSQFLIIVGGALLLAVIGYLFYQNSQLRQQLTSPEPPTAIPLTDETANWKTYENTKVGFSIKYPPRYPKPGLPSGLGPIIYADGTEDNIDIIFGQTSTDSFSLYVFPFSGSLDEIIQTRQAQGFPPYSWVESQNIAINKKDTLVDGESALWLTASYKNVSYNTDTYTAVFFTGKGHAFILHASPNHDEKEISQILSTFQFTEDNSASKLPAKQVTRLTYSLPSGWKTLQDTTGTFEVGYDPTKSVKQLTENLRVDILKKWEDNPPRVVGYDFTIGIRPYNGGSRHSFIFPEPRQGWEKLQEYHEEEYLYSGWSCLVLYGTYVSQSNITWGMCAIDSKQAFSFSSNTMDEDTIEQIISTIRLLK